MIFNMKEPWKDAPMDECCSLDVKRAHTQLPVRGTVGGGGVML